MKLAIWFLVMIGLLTLLGNQAIDENQVSAIEPSPTPSVKNYKVTIIYDPTPVPEPIQIEREIKSVFKEYAESALKVARCESGLNPGAKNKYSSARGLYQIILSTWEDYNCDGSRLNFKDNIACAKKIFDRNGERFNTTGGWRASYACHQQP